MRARGTCTRGTPEAGAVFRAALEPIIDELFNAARVADVRESREGYAFDALIELADRGSGAGAGDVTGPGTGAVDGVARKRPSPRFFGLIRVDFEALCRGALEDDEVCEIAGLGPVPVSVARELLGESVLKLVITKGVDVMNVTHLGRSATIAQKVALLWRSPGCEVEGCTRTQRLQEDHRIGWAKTRQDAGRRARPAVQAPPRLEDVLRVGPRRRRGIAADGPAGRSAPPRPRAACSRVAGLMSQVTGRVAGFDERGVVAEGQWPDIMAMCEWLQDPANAEPCATFPVDAARVSGPGVYAWHGDAAASALVSGQLLAIAHPLYVDQAGADSSRTRRASGATLKSAIVRHHLHGGTQASSLRRALAALLWNELDLRCVRPRVLEAESNARLTAWMLEHLSVTTVPFDDRSSLGLVVADLISLRDPPLNLGRYPNTPSRKRLRALVRKHFSLASADADRIDRLLKLQAFAAGQDSGSDFLRRRVMQEQRKVVAQWTATR